MKKEILMDESLYSINSLMKASYRHTDKVYIYFKRDENDKIVIEFTLKEDGNLDDIINEFKNDLLHEKIREELYSETKNIRELILSRAIYGLALEDSTSTIEITENKVDFSELGTTESYLDDKTIGKSWY